MANILLQGMPPTHPGEVLREDVLPALGRSKAEIAQALGISRQSLHKLLDERQPVTPQMAIRLGKLLGNGPEMWMRLQIAHDLARAQHDMADAIAGIPTLAAA